MTIQEIREKYPDPIEARKGSLSKGQYCVGGAYLLANNIDNDFPSKFSFVEELEKLEGIKQDKSIELVEEMMKFNDRGEFEEAWELLERVVKLKEGSHE